MKFPDKALLSINSDEVHIWVSFVNKADEELLEGYQKMLSPEETERWRKFHFPEDQRRFLVSRALLRTTLSRYIESAPEDWRFVQNERGRPEISPELASLPLRFNISHTREVVICGVTPELDIGVDVENAARDTDCLLIAKRYFDRSEFEDLLGLEGEARTRRFFEYWTLKEAVVKALGEGLYFPLDEFKFSSSLKGISLLPSHEETFPPSDESVIARFDSHPQHDSRPWQFWRFRVGPSHIAAAALIKNDASPFRLRVEEVVPRN